MDTLSLLLSRFAVSAGVFYTGRICGVHSFDADQTRGHLHLIERGPVELTDHEGNCVHIAEPTLLFLPRPEQHTLVADETQGAKVLCATVQFGVGNNNPISSSLPALVSVRLGDLEGATSLLELVGKEVFGGEPGGQAAVDRLCELLIIRLLRHCLQVGLTSGGTLAALSDCRLGKAVAAIHKEPTRPWDLVHMAAEAGMSRARFASRFREVTGQTPADYLASWRITIAQHLLKSGRAMKQVSVETGYGSSSAFTRAFVRKVGVPPSRWLRELEASGTGLNGDTHGEQIETRITRRAEASLAWDSFRRKASPMHPIRLLPVVALSVLAACAPMRPQSAVGAPYQTLTASWPADTQKVIQKMVAKYGPPQEASSGTLVWHNNGPWKRTVIYREEVPHAFPKPHKDVMEQFINYRVPAGKASELLAYDGSVVPYRTNGELSARCDLEEANFLAINLAHDIATGRRTVEDARAFYAQTIKAMMAGTMSPYLQGFIFPVPRGGTADPDRPAM